MGFRRLCTYLLFCLVAGLTLNGCASKAKPVVWINKDVNFADYQALEILPVFNATDRPLAETVLNQLTALLKARFEERQLKISVSPEVTGGILVVKSEVVMYADYEALDYLRTYGIEGGGQARCTLRTRLIDKVTNRVVATITAVDAISAGGVYPVPYGYPAINRSAKEKILEGVAELTAEEVLKILTLQGEDLSLLAPLHQSS